MVENTLGKYWIEHNENDELCDNWKYFIKDNIENNGDKLTNRYYFYRPLLW